MKSLSLEAGWMRCSNRKECMEKEVKEKGTFSSCENMPFFGEKCYEKWL